MVSSLALNGRLVVDSSSPFTGGGCIEPTTQTVRPVIKTIMNEELLNEKLDQLKVTTNYIHEQVLKTNGRVTALEKFQYMVIGAITILGAMIGWVVTYWPHK